jgi:hypothetical protein
MLRAIAITFFALGLLAAWKGVSRGKVRDWWLAVWSLGLAGCAYWLAQGSTIPLHRVVLIVTPGSESADSQLVQNLITFGTKHERWSKVAWASIGGGGTSTLDWRSPQEWHGSPPRFAPHRLDLPQGEDTLDFSELFQLRAITREAASRFLNARPTLILVLDSTSEAWKRSVARAPQPVQLEGVDILVWDRRDREPQGRLDLTLPEELQLEKPYDRGGTLRIHHAVGEPFPDKLTISVGGEPVEDPRNESFNYEHATKSPQPVFFGLAGSGNPSGSTGSLPQFVYITAEVSMILGGHSQKIETGGFVRRIQVPVEFTRRPANDVTWEHLRWLEQLDRDTVLSFAVFKSPYFGRHRRNARPGAPPNDLGIPRLINLDGILKDAPASGARGRILERPSLADVTALKEQVRAGLNLLVIDPEPAVGTEALLDWLPAWPLRQEDEHLTKHTDSRFYFLADRSRVSQLKNLTSLGDASKLSAAQYQDVLLKELAGRLPDVWLNSKNIDVPMAVTQPPRIVDAPFVSSSTTTHRPLFALGPLAPTPAANYLKNPGAPVGSTVDAPNTQESELAKRDALRDADTQAAHLGFRLWLLLNDSGTRKGENKLPLINPREFYSNTHVFLFATDVPQLRKIQINPALPSFAQVLTEFQIDAGTTPFEIETVPPEGAIEPGISLLQKLRDAGVQIHLITLQSGVTTGRPTLADSANVLFPRQITTPLAKSVWEIPENELTAGGARKFAAEMVKLIETTPDTIEIKQTASIIDQRVRSGVVAPWVYTPLKVKRPEDVYAFIKSGAENHDLIAAKRFGFGQVVIVGYSPFAMDVWTADSFRDAITEDLINNPLSTFPRSADAIVRYNYDGINDPAQKPVGSQNGWGVQRIIDFCTLTCAGGGGTAEYWPRKVDFNPATREIFLSLRLQPGPGILSPPVLQGVTPSRTWDLPLVRLLTQEQEAIYLIGLQDDLPNQSVEIRRNGKTMAIANFAGLPSATPLTLGGVTAAWAQRGGARFLPTEEDKAQWPLAQAGVVAWLVSAILALALLFLTGYRGKTIRQSLLSLASGRTHEATAKVEQFLPIDVEAALAEFGFNPGKATPSRTPGEPAGWRLHEPSDPLTQARISDLVPYTDLGKDMDLPFVRPSVKLRKSLRAFRAEIWLDLHTRLQLTPERSGQSKSDYIRALLLLVSQSVWMQGGSVQVRCLQDAAVAWGPGSQGSFSSLEEWHDGLDRSRLQSPRYSPGLAAELEQGTRLYIVSDFAFADDAFLGDLNSLGASGLQGLRLIRVTDEAELEIGTLHASLPGLILFDRSDWDSHELRQESAHALRILRSRLDGIPNTRLVDVNNTYIFQDLLLKLEGDSFFHE